MTKKVKSVRAWALMICGEFVRGGDNSYDVYINKSDAEKVRRKNFEDWSVVEVEIKPLTQKSRKWKK